VQSCKPSLTPGQRGAATTTHFGASAACAAGARSKPSGSAAEQRVMITARMDRRRTVPPLGVVPPAAAGSALRYTQTRVFQQFDMLAGQVPGRDLFLGLPRRLFATCRDLAVEYAQLQFVV
jgi:hypothetical protein